MSIDKAIAAIEKVKDALPCCPDHRKAYDYRVGLFDEAVEELRKAEKESSDPQTKLCRFHKQRLFHPDLLLSNRCQYLA